MLSLLFLIFALSQCNENAFPVVNYAGMEVIYNVGSYCSSLVTDGQDVSQRFYFLCDQSAPNLRIGYKQPFSLSSTPLTIGQPFNSLSVLKDNIVGAAYPYFNNITYNFIWQELQTNKDQIVGSIVGIPNNITFFTFLIDPNVNVATNTTTVYMAGWSSNPNNIGFVIAKGTMDVGPVSQGVIIVDYDNDVTPNILQEDCYDLYDDTVKPKMYFSNKNQNIILLLPGRCGYAFNFTIFQPFSGAPFTSFDLTTNRSCYIANVDTNRTCYVSGIDFDPFSNMIFYVNKVYRHVNGVLYAVNASGNQMFIAADMPLPMLGYATTVVSAQAYAVYVTAVGGNFILRAMWDTSTQFFLDILLKTLPLDLNKVADSFIVQDLYDVSWLYFVTNEANSKLVRARGDQFCLSICTGYGYCDSASLQCMCLPGYNMTDQNVCELSVYYTDEIQEIKIHRAEVAIGIVFAISVLVSVAGWGMFYRAKGRQSETHPQLLGAQKLASNENDFDHDNL